MSDSELMGVDVNLDHGVNGGAEPVPHRRAGRGLGRVAGWATRRDGRRDAGDGTESAVSGGDAPTVVEELPTGDAAADGPAGRAAALRRLTSDLSAPRSAAEAPTVDDLDAVTLLDDPFQDDDLAGELRSRAPLPVTRTTVVLAGLVLVVAGFLGGVLVEKNFGTTSSSGATGGNGFPAALASRGAGGGFGNAGGGGGGGGANGGSGTGGAGTGTGRGTTTGTVTLVDGTTVYVTTANGDVVIIKTTGSTTVRTDQTIPLKDLPVGASVSVTGTTGADGSVTATQITQAKK